MHSMNPEQEVVKTALKNQQNWTKKISKTKWKRVVKTEQENQQIRAKIPVLNQKIELIYNQLKLKYRAYEG